MPDPGRDDERRPPDEGDSDDEPQRRGDEGSGDARPPGGHEPDEPEDDEPGDDEPEDDGPLDRDELERAFNEAYDECRSRLRTYILILLRRNRLAGRVSPSDVVQDALLRVWRECLLRRALVRPFAGYLFGVTKNVVLEYCRRESRTDELPRVDGKTVELPADVTTASMRMFRFEWLSILFEALGRLSDDELRHVQLFLEGLRQSQIAEDLEISPSACRKRWERLRAKLRAILRELGLDLTELFADEGDDADADADADDADAEPEAGDDGRDDDDSDDREAGGAAP